MSLRDTPYAHAVQALLEKVSSLVFDGNLPSQPVSVVIAGGAAVHLYTGSRVSKDLDAEFLARMLKPEAVVSYADSDGTLRTVHLDRAYNNTLGFMHEDYLERATTSGLSAPGFSVQILAPVDLAISKLGRWQEHDRGDVQVLVDAGLLDRGLFERLANEALSYYVGNVRMAYINLEEALSMFPPPSDRDRREVTTP
jgi:hypothetical protein